MDRLASVVCLDKSSDKPVKHTVRRIWVLLLVDESVAGCIAIASQYIHLVSAAFAEHLLYELLHVAHGMLCLMVADVVDAGNNLWQASMVDRFITGGWSEDYLSNEEVSCSLSSLRTASAETIGELHD